MTMHNKKILNSNPLLFFSMLCIVIIIFLTSTVNVHAENITDPFPYNVYEWRDENSFYPDELIIDVLAAVVNDSSNTVDIDNCFVVPYICNDNGDNYFYVCSQGYFQSISNLNIGNSVEFVNNGSNYSCVTVVVRYENGVFDSPFVYRWYNSGDTYDCFGSANPIIYGSSQVRLDYPVLCFGEFHDVNDNLVLYNTAPWVDPEPSDIVPFLDFTGDVSNTFDDSLSDVVNQKNWFNNLTTTIKNAFNTLKGWLSSGFSNLAANIRSFFAPWFSQFYNVFNSISGNIEDFKDHFSKFFQIIASIYNLGLKNGEFDLPTLVVGLIVPDVNQLSGIIRSSVLGAIVFSLSTFSANTISFVQSWFNTTPVYIYHIPDFTFHGQTISGLYFDFSWYSTYKPYGDAIISFWLVINYGMFLLRFVPRFLRSAGSGYSEGSDIVDYYDHPDRDDGSYYFENGMRAPSMFDFM